MLGRSDRLEATGEIPDRADNNYRENADDEEVRRTREQLCRFPDAPQVAEHQHQHEAEAQRDGVRLPLRKCGRDRRDTRGDAD
jgi:hypothetical protein